MTGSTRPAGARHRLDSLDHQLIAELRRDPRASVIDLAGQLATSRSIVQNRLTQLLDDGAVQILGLVDPALLGRPVVAFLKIASSAPPEPLLQHLISMPEVAWAATTTVVTTLLAQVTFPDHRQLGDFVDTSIRALPSVEHVGVDIVFSVLTSSAENNPDNPAWVMSQHAEPDGVNQSIIEQLRINGRTPFAKLAKVSGLSTPAARQRTLRLLENGTIRIRAVVDPVALGLHAQGEVHISVRRDAASTARLIAAMPNVDYVVQTFGSCEIYANFHCPTLAELLRARQQVARLDNVLALDFYQHQAVVTKTPLWS